MENINSCIIHQRVFDTLAYEGTETIYTISGMSQK